MSGENSYDSVSCRGLVFPPIPGCEMSSARARGAGTLASSFAMTPVARATIDGSLGPESKRPERGGERTQRCSQSNEPPGATGPNEPELSVAPNEPGRCRQSNPRRNGPNEPERSAAPNEPECGRKPNEPRHTGTNEPEPGGGQRTATAPQMRTDPSALQAPNDPRENRGFAVGPSPDAHASGRRGGPVAASCLARRAASRVLSLPVRNRPQGREPPGGRDRPAFR
jgi:hypothetical protein